MPQYIDDTDGDAQHHDDNILNAVVAWFRFYAIPFDEVKTHALCADAMRLFSKGFDEAAITANLVQPTSV
jgi:hypothetical protein